MESRQTPCGTQNLLHRQVASVTMGLGPWGPPEGEAMARSWRRRTAAQGGAALDLYGYAFLAGGRQRVVESAVVALTEQGVLSLSAARLRATGDLRSGHPVEEAVMAACPRSRRVQEVIDRVGRSQPVDDIARRLAGLGLLSHRRQRITRRGRRLLAAAAAEAGLPAYVREGPATLPAGPVQRGLLAAHPIPDGLGRALRSMGRALDDRHDASAGDSGDGGSSGGFGGGSGSGGGGD
ncbi:TIGR04222 domain-containing membrane protein [Streptomyces rubiginosohelvolus]|uniref:TIGR04222 domain-containing membrane protein n=1 Tax=Streptomyces rubiginosohelvolus TaxID=67362 RepID=UPI00386DB281